MSVYVDTSVLGKMLVDSPESAALEDWLGANQDPLVSSDLLETELRRLAVRERLDQAEVTKALDHVSLADLDRPVYRQAGLLPMRHLRTLDALHLQAAIRLDADAMLTYDHRLADAARSLGIDILHPGR
ncbi:MAG: type II toxin-antitoxin system VapC family toxin [Microlunatus sp.]